MKHYPEYKESGVEWIGEIPAHWNLSMLKYKARLVYGDTLIAENREDGVVPVYGSNGIIDTHSAANTLSPAIVVGRKGSLGKIQSIPYLQSSDRQDRCPKRGLVPISILKNLRFDRLYSIL